GSTNGRALGGEPPRDGGGNQGKHDFGSHVSLRRDGISWTPLPSGTPPRGGNGELEGDATPAPGPSQRRSEHVLGQVGVALRPAVPVELPVRPDLVDQVEVEVADHELVLVAATHGQDLAVGVAEVG